MVLLNTDNMSPNFPDSLKVDLVYADCIYESKNFTWIKKYINLLKENGIFIVQTDYHSVAETKMYLDYLGMTFVNWIIWKNEFGNFKKDRFRQCHDDILIYCNGDNWKFNAEVVQVPKVTAKSKGLNKSGRETKLATSVITDICLTTISKERVKNEDDHCVRWQKPIDLLLRLISPFVERGDQILDPFMGTGTSGIVARLLGCEYIGIEQDPEVFKLAEHRLEILDKTDAVPYLDYSL
jgi:modification methylase